MVCVTTRSVPDLKRAQNTRTIPKGQNMKMLRALAVPAVLLLMVSLVQSQSWQPLAHQPTFNASTQLLLTDGTLIVQVYGTGGWWKFTHDINGTSVNGTWTQVDAMQSS